LLLPVLHPNIFLASLFENAYNLEPSIKVWDRTRQLAWLVA